MREAVHAPEDRRQARAHSAHLAEREEEPRLGVAVAVAAEEHHGAALQHLDAVPIAGAVVPGGVALIAHRELREAQDRSGPPLGRQLHELPGPRDNRRVAGVARRGLHHVRRLRLASREDDPERAVAMLVARSRRQLGPRRLVVQDEPLGRVAEATMDVALLDVAVPVLVERVEGTRAAVPGVTRDRLTRFAREQLQPTRAERFEQLIRRQAVVVIRVERVPHGAAPAPLPAAQAPAPRASRSLPGSRARTAPAAHVSAAASHDATVPRSRGSPLRSGADWLAMPASLAHGTSGHGPTR